MAAIPYTKYEDVARALEWLTEAFGFTEQQRFAHPDGPVFHAEMLTRAGDPVYLAGPGDGYESPGTTGYRSAMVSVDVEDVDAQYKRAEAAGATLVFPPTDTPQGTRICKVEDLEGHEWFFSQKLTTG
ncbi:VOC family protein [Streptomyces sp. SID3212]|uniref:VOC family protein n=1 Tax=unclassified Streptomyces TaxID=2593676 RepID=UPI00136A7DF6|nr:VOC family protein [Streptomyces sp. SID3212]MYV53272.1 glyoxalase [Streptomyces sp. SID3212]